VRCWRWGRYVSARHNTEARAKAWMPGAFLYTRKRLSL
jgi:hypothetical protein